MTAPASSPTKGVRPVNISYIKPRRARRPVADGCGNILGVVQNAAPAAFTPVLDAGQRRIVRRCLSAIGLLSSLSMFGVAFSLYLVNHAPLLLVALAPLGRHIWLVAPIVNPFAFVAVVTLRRISFYVASFFLGRALGDDGIPWIEDRAAWFGRFVRWLERLFGRAPRSVVLGLNGPTVSALAGISAMPFPVFGALATTGMVIRLVIILQFAEQIRPWIEAVLAWIDRYWLPGTAMMILGVLLYRWKGRRRLPRFEV